MEESARRGTTFVGAIDAAVSCAMILYIAKYMTPYLENSPVTNRTIQLVFFDGEEKINAKSNSEFNGVKRNSLYGSKHLAQKWSETPMSFEELCFDQENFIDKQIVPPWSVNNIANIELMVLLDLIGSKNPRFFNTELSTLQYFHRLVKIGKSLEQTDRQT